jgi:hypothetical protein
VKTIDQLLNAMHAAMKSSSDEEIRQDVSGRDAALIGVSLGASFGEIVRAKIGGQCIWAEFKGPDI